MKRTLCAAVVLAATAAAISEGSCNAFDKGTEILGNIVERYYGPENAIEELHSYFLHRTAQDATDVANIAKARVAAKRSDSKCKDTVAAVDKFASAYEDVAKKYTDAIKPCTTFPAYGAENDCLNAAGPALKAEKLARDPGGPYPAYADAVKAHPECVAAGASQADEDLLFERMKKQPCERDDRCQDIRIGKMRDSQVYFARAGKASPSTFSTDPDDIALRAVFYDEVKPKLLKGEGGSCNPPPDDAGGEHVLWCMRDHPDVDNTYLFKGTSQVAKAFNLARKDGGALCGKVLDDDMAGAPGSGTTATPAPAPASGSGSGSGSAPKPPSGSGSGASGTGGGGKPAGH
jgi:hypothetical protein